MKNVLVFCFAAVFAQFAFSQEEQKTVVVELSPGAQVVPVVVQNDPVPSLQDQVGAEARTQKRWAVEASLFSSGNMSSDSSPIPDLGVDAKSARSLRLIGPIMTGKDNLKFVLGYAQEQNSVTLGGVNIGNVASTTMDAGARIYLNEALENFKHASFYAGTGLFNRQYSDASLFNGGLRLRSSSMAGIFAEAGTTIELKGRVYADLNFKQYFGQTGYTRLETSSGNSLLTNVRMGNPSVLSLSVGVRF